jgi:ubiquinone/menaquinone biosynthesis C-methylase UbiE
MNRVVGEDMRAYYERRAREYDNWWLGSGLFAARERPGWAEEVRELTAALAALGPAATLDVACGTGFLTRYLPGAVTALDQSPAMVEIARGRLPEATVVEGDAVPLPFADRAFERVFTSHFYGHLLADERTAFLTEARRVAGELVVADSARRPDGPAEDWQERALSDGSRHRVYKRWFRGPELATELGGGEVLMDGSWFVLVRARPSAGAQEP